jgi:membrane protease YdiL (CAAX protease family)
VSRPHDPPVLNLFGLRLPLRETVVALVVTLVLMVDWYHGVDLPIGPDLSRGLQRLTLFGIVPLITLLLLGERPSDYGLRIGEWRIGLGVAAGMAALVTPVILLVAGQPDFGDYYRAEGDALTGRLLGNGIDVTAAEFLYRGFLMWTLVRVAGPVGVVLATFPFTLSHLGKPELETLSTFFGGLAFGWLGWRTRSVLYGALLHAYVISLVVLAASR